MILLVLGLMSVLAQPSSAHPVPSDLKTNVDFHTLSEGSRGADVKALQYLLRHHGYIVSIDGAFGPRTEQRVKEFQGAEGKTADGVVGPGTWAALVDDVVLRQGGIAPNAVRALTILLDKENRARSLRSTFDSTVKSWVEVFQRDVGISDDGVVGPTTWKYLVFHYEQPPVGSYLCKGLNGTEDNFNYAQEAWGTAATVAYLQRASRRMNDRFGSSADVAFRDLSYEHGGLFHEEANGRRQHGSHQRGMDADLRPMSTSRAQCSGGLTHGSSNYSEARTHQLYRYLLDASDALGRDLHKVTFFNDKDIYDQEPEMTRLNNHDNHLHVRFCTAYYRYSSSYDC